MRGFLRMNFFSGNYFSMAGFCEEYIKTICQTPVYYGIQYNHSGGVYVRVDGGERYEETGPCVFFTHPNALFEYGPLNNQPRDHHFICFHGPRVQQYLDSGLLPLHLENPIIKINYPEEFHVTVMELISMINGSGGQDDRTVLKLEDLLLQVHEQNNGPKNLPSYQMPLFTAMLKQIRNTPQHDWNFKKEAAKLHITQTHFRRLFKQCSGMSPQQYLIHHRLHSAARLLTSTQEQISTIAEQVGVGSEYYFSRLFKKKYQLSPLRYRREFSGH